MSEIEGPGVRGRSSGRTELRSTVHEIEREGRFGAGKEGVLEQGELEGLFPRPPTWKEFTEEVGCQSYR